MESNTRQILNDLYRLGFLGNFMPGAGTHRWQHKGDEGLILDDIWSIEVHLALKSILSLNSKQDYYIHSTEALTVGKRVIAKVKACKRNYAFVTFDYYGVNYGGRISIKEFGKKLGKYIETLVLEIENGSEWDGYLESYDEKFDSWNIVFEQPCYSLDDLAKTINDKYHMN